MVDVKLMLAAGLISFVALFSSEVAISQTASPNSLTASPINQPSQGLNPWWSLLLLPVGGAAALLYQRQAQSTQIAQPANAAPVPAPEPVTPIEAPSTTVAISQSYTATRLAKIDIVEALVSDLQSPDAAKRRKAIWELGQSGDSRAVQPLVDLLLDADSQQRSLILGAVSEINARSLKPMNRALMLALQDESPDVRRNAIRDVTRVYELMTQVSQLLQYAASDSDSEVQETAHWALSQLNRMQSLPQAPALSPDPKRPDSPVLESSDSLGANPSANPS